MGFANHLILIACSHPRGSGPSGGEGGSNHFRPIYLAHNLKVDVKLGEGFAKTLRVYIL